MAPLLHGPETAQGSTHPGRGAVAIRPTKPRARLDANLSPRYLLPLGGSWTDHLLRGVYLELGEATDVAAAIARLQVGKGLLRWWSGSPGEVGAICTSCLLHWVPFLGVSRHGSLAEFGYSYLHPGAPVMPESPGPAGEPSHVYSEAPAFPQLPVSPGPGVSLS